MDCRRASEVIDQYFVKRSPRALARMKPHLESCPDCQGRYTALFELEAGLSFKEDAPDDTLPVFSPSEREMLKAQVLDGARAESAPRRGWLRILAPAAMVALLVLVVTRVELVSPPDTWKARGGHDGLANVGLRLHCVNGEGENLATHALKASPKCPASGGIMVSYFNASGADAYLSVFAVGADGTYRQMYPEKPGDDGRVPVTEDEVHHPYVLFLEAIPPGTLNLRVMMTADRPNRNELMKQMQSSQWRPAAKGMDVIDAHIAISPLVQGP